MQMYVRMNVCIYVSSLVCFGSHSVGHSLCIYYYYCCCCCCSYFICTYIWMYYYDVCISVFRFVRFWVFVCFYSCLLGRSLVLLAIAAAAAASSVDAALFSRWQRVSLLLSLNVWLALACLLAGLPCFAFWYACDKCMTARATSTQLTAIHGAHDTFAKTRITALAKTQNLHQKPTKHNK